jgi:hypothetical protein
MDASEHPRRLAAPDRLPVSTAAANAAIPSNRSIGFHSCGMRKDLVQTKWLIRLVQLSYAWVNRNSFAERHNVHPLKPQSTSALSVVVRTGTST